VSAGRSRRFIAFGALGAAAYLAALAATIPAAAIWAGPPAAGVSGTLWRGTAAFAGGHRLHWSWAPLRSLTGLGFAADVGVTGPGTALTGRALIRPGQRVVTALKGRADGTLLAAFVPAMPFVCVVPARVDLDRLALGRRRYAMVGEVSTGAGTCQPATGPATAVPGLRIAAGPAPGGTRATIVPRVSQRPPLAAIGLSESGRLTARITRAGAAALPFLAPPGGGTIETTL